MNYIFLLAFLLVAIVILFAAVGVLAVSNAKLWIKIGAMEKSTHQITYIDPIKAAEAELGGQNLTEDEEATMGADPFNTIN